MMGQLHNGLFIQSVGFTHQPFHPIPVMRPFHVSFRGTHSNFYRMFFMVRALKPYKAEGELFYSMSVFKE